MIRRLMIAVVALSVFAGGIVTANVAMEQISVARNTINLEVNGAEVEADNFIYEGRTYVQLREIAEMLGKDVGWDGATRTASINDSVPTPVPTIKPLETIKPLATPKPLATIKPVDDFATRKNPATVKEIVGVTDGAMKYKISVSNIIRGKDAALIVKNANQFNKPPKEGMEYLIAGIAFELDEANEPYQLRESNFDLVSEKGTVYNTKPFVVLQPEVGTTLYEGAVHGGFIVFEVYENDLCPLIVFDVNYDGTGGIWFKTVVNSGIEDDGEVHIPMQGIEKLSPERQELLLK